MLAYTKARLQKQLLFLGVVLAHILAFLALAHRVVFSAPADDTSAFMGVKIMLPAQPQVKSPPPVPPMPALEFAGGNGAGRASDLLPSIPPPQISVLHSFNDTIAKVINSDIQNSRNETIRFMTKSNIDLQIHGAGNGQNSSDEAGNGTGTGAGEDKGAGEASGVFPTSQDEKVVFILEKQPSRHYLYALQRHYLRATLILSWSGREDYSPDPKIWNPAPNRPCNPDGTAIPDPHNPWIDDQETDVKRPDILSYDLYAGIYWAIHHGSKTAIVISNFQDGYNPDATQAIITAMRSAHLKLFLVSGHTDPDRGLMKYALECGGKILFCGSDYGSLDWDSYTRVIGVGPEPTR